MAVTITQTANPAGVSASSNVATYTDAAIGTAAPNRIVVVLVGSELASTPIASCTIGGNAMNAGTQGNQGAVYARAFYLLYPTGTTATVAVTFTTNSPSSTQNHIAVYTVTDAAYSSTGADKSTDMDATDPLTTGSTVIAAGGGMIAVAACATDTVAKAWANLGEDIDDDAGALRFTTAFSTTAGTATRTCTGTTNGEDGAMSWLIFADNTAPTTALNTPADAATGVSVTPTLNFTGTDADSDTVEYQAQVGLSSFVDVSCANLTSGNDVDGGSSATTASITLTSNKLSLISITSRHGTADPNHPTVTGWTEVSSLAYDTSAGASQKRVTVLRRLASGDSTGTLTIDFAGQGQTDIAWVVDEFTGMDTGGTNGANAIVQTATNIETSGTATTLTATLSSFSAVNNATYGAIAIGNKTLTVTPGSGFTKISDGEAGLNGVHMTGEFRNDNDTTVDFVTSVAGELGVIAIEIKSATPSLINALSASDAGFTAGHPFASGVAKDFTVQAGDTLSNSTVYYWRVRAIDPGGSNSYGAYATTRSFTTTSGGGVAYVPRMGFVNFQNPGIA